MQMPDELIPGDMNKPIYRYLADRKWRSYKRLVLMQRITQLNIVPDVLPKLDPVADVTLAFGRRRVDPGDMVDSRVSEQPGHLRVQVFDKGERLVTIAAIDSDVPNVTRDGFDFRCHFLACNIPVSPTSGSIALSKLDESGQQVKSWLPPFSVKGAPYHRLTVFVLQQAEGQKLEVEEVRKKKRRGFNLRSFVDAHKLHPVGVTLFRTEWDEGTAGVMERAGISGADTEFKRKKVEPLPYKKKDGARYR